MNYAPHPIRKQCFDDVRTSQICDDCVSWVKETFNKPICQSEI